MQKKMILKFLILLLSLALFLGCSDKKESPFVETVKSKYSTPISVEKFQKILEDEGLSLFQVIDHAQNAKNEGLELLPETVIVFGNAKMGTMFMQCNQTMGLELPLRILFFTDYDGENWISYTNPEYYTLKHNIKDKECLALIGKVNIAMQKLVGELSDSNTTQK